MCLTFNISVIDSRDCPWNNLPDVRGSGGETWVIASLRFSSRGCCSRRNNNNVLRDLSIDAIDCEFALGKCVWFVRRIGMRVSSGSLRHHTVRNGFRSVKRCHQVVHVSYAASDKQFGMLTYSPAAWRTKMHILSPCRDDRRFRTKELRVALDWGRIQ